MKRILLAVAALLMLSTPALAAKPPASTPTYTGNDVSYPQCGKALPAGQAFGIVGVNGGLANTTNPCLAAELTWAAKSTGATSQPKAQLYVNTANPGGLNTASWPQSGLNAYGTCDGSNTSACAYQYGWNRAEEDVQLRLLGAAPTANPASYIWWLDVETANTWDTSTGGVTRNRADLEGMTAYFHSLGATIGLYSTSAQWQSIAGTVDAASNLSGLPNWRPGARTLAAATSNCSLAPLTVGGVVAVTQYVSGTLDYDYSCN